MTVVMIPQPPRRVPTCPTCGQEIHEQREKLSWFGRTMLAIGLILIASAGMFGWQNAELMSYHQPDTIFRVMIATLAMCAAVIAIAVTCAVLSTIIYIVTGE